jgi:hypothetical protein
MNAAVLTAGGWRTRISTVSNRMPLRQDCLSTNCRRKRWAAPTTIPEAPRRCAGRVRRPFTKIPVLRGPMEKQRSPAADPRPCRHRTSPLRRQPIRTPAGQDVHHRVNRHGPVAPPAPDRRTSTRSTRTATKNRTWWRSTCPPNPRTAAAANDRPAWDDVGRMARGNPSTERRGMAAHRASRTGLSNSVGIGVGPGAGGAS